MTYRHPTYTAASVRAQQQLGSLNSDRLAFAGAYHGWGFHEDGCRAGVAAAEALGASW
jgi:predicted NAD/FAD-binding protein